MLQTLDRPQKAKSSTKPSAAAKIDDRVIVTPEIAAAWLDKNDGNRRVSARHVDRLARDMKAGNFAFTGDPIRFDSDSRLIDGQHRLLACVKSGVPFETTVIYNLPPDVQARIDAGKSRSPGDILSMDGHHNTIQLTSAARFILAETAGVDAFSGSANNWTTSEILACIERHKELPASVRHVLGKRLPVGISAGHVAAIHYIGARIINAPKTADSFVEVLHSGVPLYEGDPAHAFREQVVRERGGNSATNRATKLRRLKHAWNLFSARQTRAILRSADGVKFVGLNYKLL